MKRRTKTSRSIFVSLAILIPCLVTATAQATIIDTLPIPAGFLGPAPACACAAGGISQLARHNPNNLAARIVYNRGDGWQAVEFPELATHLGNHPTEANCVSYVEDGQVRSIITFMAQDKSGGFGMFTLVLDFPTKGDPTSTEVIAHTLYPEPGVDVTSSSVDYDTTTGRIVAAGISGIEITYFNAGLDAADLVVQPLPDLTSALTSADYPKNQVDVSAKTQGVIYLITFDRDADKIFYRSSLDGMDGVTNMVSGNRIVAMEATSGSGPAASGVEWNSSKQGLWITYRDADGTTKRRKITSSIQVKHFDVARSGPWIVVVWGDDESGTVKVLIINTQTGSVSEDSTAVYGPDGDPYELQGVEVGFSESGSGDGTQDFTVYVDLYDYDEDGLGRHTDKYHFEYNGEGFDLYE